MSTLTDHWANNVAPVWKTHWGDALIITTRTDTQTVTGVVSRVSGEQLEEENWQIVSHDVDILFVRSDVTVDIAAGTRITHTTGGKDVTYEVLAEAGQPAWEYDDPARTKIRVRGKIVDEDESV